MNKLIPITLLVVLSIVLAACGQATQTAAPVNDATQPSVTPYPSSGEPTADTSAYPSSGEQTGNTSAYPGAETAPQILVPYPAPLGYELAKYASLADIEQYIKTGQAAEIILTANKEAFVKLSDGTSVWTNNTTAEAVQAIIQACGDACKNIPLTLP